MTTGSTAYPAWGLSEVYDRYGNRTAQNISSGCTGIGCPTNTISVNNTTNHVTGSTFAYDLSGNMTNDGTNTITYDGEGRAVTATNGGGSGTYAYDGSGLRVKKVSGSTTTVYIFSGSKVIAEYVNGAAPSSPTREYIYGGGALLARIDSSGTNYYHQDHLSNRMVTSSSGSVVTEMGHFPFGESWYNATNDKLYFTTYEYDAESGNHYAMARYHISRLGRLASPDPLPGSTANPQSLNRYSYSVNDPANVTDPSGALINCNTAQSKPKDKSQQASSGDGPSDTDNPDADKDTDPPPQNGCPGSRTDPHDWFDPFGGSSEFGQDLADIMQVGDDSNQLPNHGFQPGGGSAGVYVVPFYFDVPLPNREWDEDDRWDEQMGYLMVVYFGPGPTPTGPGNADSQQQQVQDLKRKLLNLLPLDPDCLTFLSHNDPRALSDIATAGISVGNLSSNRGIMAITSVTFSPSNPMGPVPQSASITVNQNSYFFVGGTTGSPLGTSVSYNSGSPQLQAQALLHEFGHVTGALLFDSNSAAAEAQNNQSIQQHCSKTINGAAGSGQ